MLPGDGTFIVSSALLGHARRQDGGFWNDRYSCRAGVTGAGSLFPRWSLVRTPRNCDSASIAPTRIVISKVRALFLSISPNICLLNDASTDRKWYSESPLERYQKPLHLVMCSGT
jgi:hypothetical protein